MTKRGREFRSDPLGIYLDLCDIWGVEPELDGLQKTQDNNNKPERRNKMKIDGEYQLIDKNGNPVGGASKEPILQNPVPGLEIRFTSVQFTGGPYDCDIMPTRIWGNKERDGVEAEITTYWEWSEERQIDVCLYNFTVIGSDPRAVEKQIAIVKYRLGVGEKPEGLIL